MAANLTKLRILKGDNAQAKATDALMREAVNKTMPVSKPYLNSDLIILHLLKNGFINEKNIDWNGLAKFYYAFEKQIRDGKADLSAYSMWTSFFPPNILWEDLPQDKAALFKNWTLARVNKAPQQVTIRKAFSLPDGAGETVTLDRLSLGEIGAQYTDFSQKGLNPEQIISLTPYVDSIGLYKVFYVFPEKLKNYKLQLPDKFRSMEKLEIEIDLKIEKIDPFLEKDSYKKEILSALVYTSLGNVRLLQNGKLIWSGQIQKDDNALEIQFLEKIQNSTNPADWQAFLKQFPNGSRKGDAQIKLEQLTWNSIKQSCDKIVLSDFLKEFPNGLNTAKAKLKLSKLSSDSDFGSNTTKAGTTKMMRLSNGAEMCFAWIPPGTFMMGSSEDDISEANREMNRLPNIQGDYRDQFRIETPQRKVSIAEGFWMAQFEVTQEQYEAVTGSNPMVEKRFALKSVPRNPIQHISWEDAKEFVVKLNKLDPKFEYRLPTEVEWEYAARGGAKTPFAFGSTLNFNQANFYGNAPYGKTDAMVSRQEVTGVGNYLPNVWGLYDMHGNVPEWVEDIQNEI